MHKLSKSTTADFADREILRGPPGLLFGLTLLIFAAARLCFGWDSSSSREDRAVQTASVHTEVQPNSEEDAPLFAGSDHLNQ